MIALAVAIALAANAPGYTRELPKRAIGAKPTRAHADLGPIVFPAKLKGRDKLAAYLASEADRLGADGFYIEGIEPPRRDDTPYSPTPGSNFGGGPLSASEGVIVAGIAVLVALTVYGAKPKTDNGVVHAFTFRTLPKETRDGLETAAAEALARRITIAEFEMRRTELLTAATAD